MTYHLSNNGTRTQYTNLDDFEDAVRDAIFEWLDTVECPVFGDSDIICCANHGDRRFRMCNACTAMEQASSDEQMWLVGDASLPYEIKLPGTGMTDARHIRAWED